MPHTKLGTYTSRKIETRMVDAVCDIRNWREGKTEVKADTNRANDLPVARVYLHGHHIANMQQVAHGRLQLQVIEEVLKQWPTPTTISRLRALGASITQTKGIVYLNGREIAYAVKGSRR